MKHVNKLETILNVHLNWHKKRINCFVQMLVVLLQVQTVNLSKISNQILSKSKIRNRYRRLQRFFAHIKIDYDVVAKFIFWLFSFQGKSIYLTMDRTNWKWGKKNINILFLGIVYKGIAIPIYWLLLNKQGNSSTNERIALMKRFIKIFGKACIVGYLGDREFIGKDWFAWLIQETIPFYVRIKKDVLTKNHRGKEIKVSWLFYHLKLSEKKVLKRSYKIYTHPLYVSGSRAPTGELMMVVSNVKSDKAIEIYYTRWEIETLKWSGLSRPFFKKIKNNFSVKNCMIK